MAAAAARRRPAQRCWPLALLLLAVHALSACSAETVTLADYRAITRNVTNLMRAEWFGSYDLLFGSATTIAIDTDSRPIVSASKSLMGRVIHFGTDGLSDVGAVIQCCQNTGFGKLIVNAVAWVGQSRGPKRLVRIAGSTNYVTTTLVARIIKEHPSTFVSVGTVKPDKVRVSTVDAYLVNGQDKAVGDAATLLQSYVASGGGLFVASHAWHWGSQYPLMQHPSNRLLNAFGIVLSAEPTQANAPVDPSVMPTNTFNCDVALECLADSCTRTFTNPCASGMDGQIADYKNLCLRVDDYMPASAVYRSRARQVYSRVAASGFSGPACSSLKELVELMPKPVPSPPPPSPPAPVSNAAFRGLAFSLYSTGWPFTAFPIPVSLRPVQTGRLHPINYYCGFTCISYRYKEKFAVKATGFIRVTKAVAGKKVSLSLSASGKARILINRRELRTLRITDGSSRSMVTKTITTTLPAGEIPITLEFLHADGPSLLQLVWMPQGTGSFAQLPLFYRKQ